MTPISPLPSIQNMQLNRLILDSDKNDYGDNLATYLYLGSLIIVGLYMIGIICYFFHETFIKKD